jgi:hypothetical protein
MTSLIEQIKSGMGNYDATLVALIAESQKFVSMKETLKKFRDILDSFQVSPISSTIRLNIGGSTVVIGRKAIENFLHIDPTNNLFVLISGKYDKCLPRDKNGALFFDLDVCWVAPLLNHARDLTM